MTRENVEKSETRQGSPRANLQKFLEIRAFKKSKTPEFQRQESWRYVRIHDPWRKPKGVDSHMRLSVKGWPALVKIGYRGPKEARGLHPSGYRDVLVHNKSELEMLSKDYDAARLAATVGKRKKIELAIRAKELGIRVLNGRGLLPAQVRAPAEEEEEEAKTEKKEEQAPGTIIPQEAEEQKLEAVQSTESEQEGTSEEQIESPPVEATEKEQQEPAEKAKPKKVAKAKKKPQKKISSKKSSKPKPKKKQQSKKKKSKKSD